jgi:hypothetical protein
MIRKIIAISGLLMGLSVLSACTQENTHATHTQDQEIATPVANGGISKKVKSNYLKPGAAVRLKHNYDGHSQVGEPELIQLSFAETYSAGQLNIALQADPGLILNPPDNNFYFAMDTDSVHSLEINVSAEAEGKYYLHMYASATDSRGSTKSRVFAIAFYVGDAYLESKSQTAAQSKVSADNLIYLPSEETVIQ